MQIATLGNSWIELSDNLRQWGYINKKQPPKTFVFRHVALTLSHLNFNLTTHPTLPYFLHSNHIPSSIYHYHPLSHIQLTISIIYSHLSPLITTPTHIIYPNISIYPTLNYYLSPFWIHIILIWLVLLVDSPTTVGIIKIRDKIKLIILPLWMYNIFKTTMFVFI